MKQIQRKTIMVVLILIGLIGFANSALAAGSLPTGLKISDDKHVEVTKEGEYFIQEYKITPGKVFERDIIISDFAPSDYPLELSLLMRPDKQKGAIDLFKAVNMTLIYDEKVIYEGSPDGSGKPKSTEQPIELGQLKTGDVKHLVAKFTVAEISEEFPEEDWQNISEIDFSWRFSAIEKDAPSSEPPSLKPKLPKTGDDWRNVIIGIIIGLLLIIVVLLVARKIRSEEE